MDDNRQAEGVTREVLSLSSYNGMFFTVHSCRNSHWRGSYRSGYLICVLCRAIFCAVDRIKADCRQGGNRQRCASRWHGRAVEMQDVENEGQSRKIRNASGMSV